MKKVMTFLTLAIGVLSYAAQADEPFLNVEFQHSNNQEIQSIKTLVATDESVNTLIDFLNTQFEHSPKGTIKLVFSDVGEDDSGPYTDLQTQTVMMPYQFIAEVKSRFEAADYEKQTDISPETATIDAVLHTILHEMAHAMIDVYDLPVVGKEEDAADSLATFILSEQFDNGQEIAISAADLFDLERQADDELTEGNYWDEHSLDAQRFYTTMCHVYGSNPEKYADLLSTLDIDEERQARCIEEYDKLASSWEKILSPWLKNSE